MMASWHPPSYQLSHRVLSIVGLLEVTSAAASAAKSSNDGTPALALGAAAGAEGIVPVVVDIMDQLLRKVGLRKARFR
jgi:hypothetical protein